MANIDLYQSGSDRTDYVWSRSLNSGNGYRACDVSGYFGGRPGSSGVSADHGVVSCFCIGTETESPFPLHENLYEYTPEELKVVSNYLTKNYSEESQDPNCIKFRTFRDSGLTTDGSDNGVAMKEDFTSH